MVENGAFSLKETFFLSYVKKSLQKSHLHFELIKTQFNFISFQIHFRLKLNV